MHTELYIRIKEYLRDLIKDTEWEGHVFTVGGCVRDEIMGNEIKDIDMCVSLQSGGIRFAKWLKANRQTARGFAVYPSYGTAMLHLRAFPDVELEFVQTRKEKYIDHTCRNPETAFGTIEEDCMRRDLTINALYTNISTGEIVDITGRGIDDIHNRIIRTPADPDLTYDDDPLRILRCIRFASRYGWDVEQDTYDGMLRNVTRLEIITKERVREEVNKMLVCRYPVMALELLRKTGAMHYVVPELEATYDKRLADNIMTVWQQTLDGITYVEQDNLLQKLAVLLHSLDNVTGIMRQLKYSNDEIDEVQFMVGHHKYCRTWGADTSHATDEQLRRIQYACGTEQRFRNLMSVVNAVNITECEGMEGQVPIIIKRTSQMLDNGSAMFGYKLPVTGKDVMAIKNIKPGPLVKQYLDSMMDMAFLDPKKGREEFLMLLKEL